MHHPPPVSVHCGGGRGWTWAVATLCALAAAALAAWVAGLLERFDLAAAAALLAAAAALLACRPWRQPRPTALVWDGSAWQADGVAGDVQVAVDLGGWMLLRLRPFTGAPAATRVLPWRWLPVAAADAGPAWHALRVAAHAHQPTASPLATPPHV
jgi:hypothetical protein